MIKRLFAVSVLVLVAVCCQSESMSENTEALSSDSYLTNVLKSMSANDTDDDDVVDSTSCFKIKLPFQVVVNGQQMKIVLQSQYADVAAILNVSQDDEDSVSLIFPVTVEDRYYNETVVNNQSEFDTMTASCIETADVIGDDCVSLVFPVNIYSYNSGFQIQNTYVLNTNKELHIMLQNLGPNGYYSVKYPVSLNVTEGAAVTVDDNNELQQGINSALQGCEQGGCTNPGILVDQLSLYMTFSNGLAQDIKGGAVIVPDNITFVADREGNQNCAIAFNGTQFLRVQANADNAIVQSQSYSVSLWFRMQNTNNGDVERLFSKGNVEGEGFSLTIKELNAPVFEAGSIGDFVDMNWKTDAALPVDTSNWHHLVVTVDANNDIRFYRDGELRSSQDASLANISSEAMDYYIGRGFKGFLDDLRVYKKALSPEEVQVLFELEGDCNTCLE